MSRSIRENYSNQVPDLVPFVAFDAGTPVQTLIAARDKFPVDRQLLVSALQRQHNGLQVAEQVTHNLALMAKDTTFTITTGQQPGLFGGPLYNLYKALTAIKLAEKYKAEAPEYNFVPVFWNATEDHDRHELNHTWLQLPKRVTYDVEFSGAVGRHIITDAIRELGAPNELLQHFAPGRSFGDAFRRLLYDWLGEYGLVVIDGDDPELKQAMRPIVEREVEDSLGAEILAQTEALAQAGYSAQLTPGTENLFLLRDGFRQQLFRDGDRFFTRKDKLTFTKAELLELAQTRPEALSPNAALRTLYQERLLPNLTVVGGWGEISYWLQLKQAFEATNTFFPLLMPRASALLLPAATKDNLDALELSVADFRLPEGELRNRVRHLHSDVAAAMAPIKARMAELHQELEAMAAHTWDSAHTHVGANAKRNAHYLAQLERRLSTVALERLPAFRQLIADKRSLLADGYEQERALNPWPFMQGHQAAFVAYLYDKLAVNTPEQQVIVLPTEFGHPFA